MKDGQPFRAPRKARWRHRVRDLAYDWLPLRHRNVAPGLEGVTRFNRILDNEARKIYAPVIERMHATVPELMARKIPEANVQQAFVLDTVQAFSHDNPRCRILSVGCYEDTADGCLLRWGYRVKGIDPALNMSLSEYLAEHPRKKGSFDIVFATSVLEHVQDDEQFVLDCFELLADGGVLILTCDFLDTFQPGDPLPDEDYRLYTQRDIRERLFPLLDKAEWVSEPDWDCLQPDFNYHGHQYTFSTLVLRKMLDGKTSGFDQGAVS